MARSSYWWLLFASVSCIITICVVYIVWFSGGDSDAFSLRNSLFGGGNAELQLTQSYLQHRCVWHEGDPVIFNLKTKMGVNYDAGHWFHMAENFMVQHSVLRSVGQLTNASHIIYSFDKGKLQYLSANERFGLTLCSVPLLYICIIILCL